MQHVLYGHNFFYTGFEKPDGTSREKTDTLESLRVQFNLARYSFTANENLINLLKKAKIKKVF